MRDTYPPKCQGLRTHWKAHDRKHKLDANTDVKSSGWRNTVVFIAKSLKEGIRKRPHVAVVFIFFIGLLVSERINFMTFLALGFFSTLLCDHLVQSIKEHRKKKAEIKREEAEKQVKKKLHDQKEKERRRQFRSLRQPMSPTSIKDRAVQSRSRTEASREVAA